VGAGDLPLYSRRRRRRDAVDLAGDPRRSVPAG